MHFITITVRVTKPLLFKGARVEAGDRLDVDPLTAADLVNSGRAALVRVSDSNEIREAVRKEIARLVPRGQVLG